MTNAAACISGLYYVYVWSEVIGISCMCVVCLCLGIGREIAKSLLFAGAVVYALSKSQKNLDSLVTEVLTDRPTE